MNKPIKRDPALVRFSRDHHFGLLLVWKMREGMRKKTETRRIADYALNFFRNELEPHFKDEEKHLFPKLDEDSELRIRAEKEHVKLRALARRLEEAEADHDLLVNFSDLLEMHIRFEERQLFNHMQETFTRSQLDEILGSAEEQKCSTDSEWKDQFWNI